MDDWCNLPGFQEDVAIEEAKQISNNKNIIAVKVIREQHDTNTGHKTEKTVFTTEVDKTNDDYQDSQNTSDIKDDKDRSGIEKEYDDPIDEYDNISEELVSEKKEEKSLSKKSKRNVKQINFDNGRHSSSVRLIIKLLIIIILSIGFAAVVTLVFERFGLSLYYKFGVD